MSRQFFLSSFCHKYVCTNSNLFSHCLTNYFRATIRRNSQIWGRMLWPSKTFWRDISITIYSAEGQIANWDSPWLTRQSLLLLGAVIPKDHLFRASQVAPVVKNSPALQEMRVRSLSLEDPLEEEMSPHSSILAKETPWTEDTHTHILPSMSISFQGIIG